MAALFAALRSKEKIETQCYKFKTKYGSYISLQSQWFSFTNPWTKEVEFIVSLNRVISWVFSPALTSVVSPGYKQQKIHEHLLTSRGPGHTKDEEAGSSKALQGKETLLYLLLFPLCDLFSHLKALFFYCHRRLKAATHNSWTLQRGGHHDLRWQHRNPNRKWAHRLLQVRV